MQTLNSRYVYISHLLNLVAIDAPTIELFSNRELNHRMEKALENRRAHEKGILWEDVAAYVLEHVQGWEVTGRRIRAGHQEIDLSITNISTDDELWGLGAYILVECKNWKKRVDLPTIRNIAYISNMKGNKTAILFAMNGITEAARQEIKRLAVNHINILCIETKDLVGLRNENDCKNLVLNKWKSLLTMVENESPI